MITSRSKWRPTNRSFMPVNLLIVGPSLPNHYCNPPDLVICTRTFCGVQPKAGRHFTKPPPNRSSPQFADYLVESVASYPEADTIHLVMDNLSSHNRKALVDRFGEKIGGLLWERFTVHYTPKHGSW